MTLSGKGSNRSGFVGSSLASEHTLGIDGTPSIRGGEKYVGR